MRTGTYNRFLNQWMYKPEIHANQYLSFDSAITVRRYSWQPCTPGHLMYSMAEMANVQRLNSNSLSLGTYFWPTFGLSARGIDYVTSADDICVASTTSNTADIELFCRTKVYLCIDAAPTGCHVYYPYKASVVWEKSTDSGLTWFIPDEGKIDLTGNVIVIGQSDWFAAQNPYRTQFYGLIDSVRISTGTPRYTGNVTQPFARRCISYYPQAAVGFSQQDVNGRPIDEHVLFALNLWNYGDIFLRDPMVDEEIDGPEAYVPVVHMPPGSTTIPYYVKNRGTNGGYHVAGDIQNPLFTATEDLAPDIRKISTTVPIVSFPDFERDRQLLTYSNISSGLFKQWPAIQFPMHVDLNNGVTGSPRVYQAIALQDEDFTPKPGSGKTRVVEVELASKGPVEGRLAGPFKTVDGSQAEVDTFVLIKDQEDPTENGIYKVRGQSAGQSLDWQRLTQQESLVPDNLSTVYVRVKNGNTNVGTSWVMTTPNPIIDESPLIFEQDKILGTYAEDFCVESWFSVSSFGHPGFTTFAAGQGDFPYLGGAHMTLLETYYRRRREQSGAYSGLRIYFVPEETTYHRSNTGKICVDFWVYASSLAPPPQQSGNPAPTAGAWIGPVFVSDVIAANQFHHVAVVRNQNVFALYVNGIKQDEILAQQKNLTPKNITAAQNSHLYRAKGFYGRLVDTTDSLSLLVKSPEFTYVPANGPEYSRNFNGAGGMIKRNSNRTVNLPCEWYKIDASLDQNNNCTGFFAGIGSGTALTAATWPGFPIPNKPDSNHVYIINDNLYTQGGSLPKYEFLFAPTMRFPDLTHEVELATVEDGTTDVYNDELLDTGNIDTGIEDDIPLFGTTITRIHPQTELPYTSTLTIDGIPVEEEMRVLVKNQTNEAQNGVYIVKSTAWVRVNDLRTTAQLKEPYRVLVTGGFTNAGTAFVLDIDSLIPIFEYQIDVTPIEFKEDTDTSSSGERFECYVERSICRGEGVDVAAEPVVLVFARTTANVNLAVGGFPGGLGVPLAAYDGTIVTSGSHRVLVAGQTNPAENGIYLMQAGAWTRVEDLKITAQYLELQQRAQNSAILVSPATGSYVGSGCSIGYRMLLDNQTEFLLGSDAINILPQHEVLNKLYVPTTWTSLDGIVDIDAETQLPLVASDAQIEWDDFIPASDDRSVWRIWTRCGNAINYSRNIIVRMASALNVTQTDSIQTLPPQECL